MAADRGYRIHEEQLGDGTSTTYDYEAHTDRIASISSTRDGHPVQLLSYLYTPGGNLDQRSNALEAAGAERFTYDALDRLQQLRQTQPGGQPERVEIYGYDEIGNLGESPIFGTATPVPGRPQLVAAAGPNSYAYDANGNQYARTGPNIPGGSQEITYTPFDMPQTITSPDASLPTVTLEYDAQEVRVAKRVVAPCGGTECPADTTYYSGDLYERRVHTESGTTTTTQDRYSVFVGSRQIAELVRGASDNADHYLLSDNLGSINVVTTAGGSYVLQTFASFGTRRVDSAGDPIAETGVTAGFTGHEQDEETGLINMGGRIYDPELGRFLTADPLVQAPGWSQGLNGYAYVFNSPMRYTDPNGMEVDFIIYAHDAVPEDQVFLIDSLTASGPASPGGPGSIVPAANVALNLAITAMTQPSAPDVKPALPSKAPSAKPAAPGSGSATKENQKATLIVRRYAEGCTFGWGFAGDCRTVPDPSDDASFRLEARLTVDFKLGNVGILVDQGATRAADPFSPAKLAELVDKAEGGGPVRGLNQQELYGQLNSLERSGDTVTVEFSFSGRNVLVPDPISPDIDTLVRASFTRTGSTVSVVGTAGGDAFPSAEFFLESNGQRVLAGSFRASQSPFGLLGEGSIDRPFATFAASVR